MSKCGRVYWASGKQTTCEVEVPDGRMFCNACGFIKAADEVPPPAPDFEDAGPEVTVHHVGDVVEQHVMAVVTVALRRGKNDMVPIVLEVLTQDPSSDGLPPDDQRTNIGMANADGTFTYPGTYGEVRRVATEVVANLREGGHDVVEMYNAQCSCGWHSNVLSVSRKVAAVIGWVHRMANQN